MQIIKPSIVALSLMTVTANASANKTLEKWQTHFQQKVEHAQEKMAEPENIGLLSGGSLGLVTGGPLGAVVGAVIGGLIGHSHEQHAELEKVYSSNSQHQLQIEQLSQNLQQQQHQQKLQLQQVSQQIDMYASPFTQGRSLNLTILFKTGSSELTEDYRQQLVGVSRLLNAMPDLNIQLTGFADQRGGANYNRQLSQQRAQSVAKFLQKMGIAAQRISFTAQGEQAHLQDDLESNFFQRKVDITIAKSPAQVVMVQ
ncbi:OmpA/MotB domain-containing protein [Catenovulum agarivorans DS-2]|uniref:OmpA/MotB domain-containing protein n=1 Tax=Catenovulum agarivorans DS-2 TaxID=1328313 RepID=W7QDY0_9ALTE|nr:sortase-associated OmpA-like protein PdsO [Catenovulum agarivorans]EWH10131.1 OmpA/MotB domain-containing protein [Catenovulum agarivorans DS-2]